MSAIMVHSYNDLPAAYELGFSEKIARSLSLIRSAYGQLGDRLVFEHNLTPESGVVWDLAKRACPKIRGFCIATRFQPPETVLFMEQLVAQYPEIRIYESFYMEIPEDLPDIDPALCCKMLRDRPKRQALEEMHVSCLMTGFHHVHGSARLDLREFEKVTAELSELTPILTWDDEDVARYVESRQISCIPPHEQIWRPGCSVCLRRERHNSDIVGEVTRMIRVQAEKNVLRGMRRSA